MMSLGSKDTAFRFQHEGDCELMETVALGAKGGSSTDAVLGGFCSGTAHRSLKSPL